MGMERRGIRSGLGNRPMFPFCGRGFGVRVAQLRRRMQRVARSQIGGSPSREIRRECQPRIHSRNFALGCKTSRAGHVSFDGRPYPEWIFALHGLPHRSRILPRRRRVVCGARREIHRRPARSTRSRLDGTRFPRPDFEPSDSTPSVERGRTSLRQRPNSALARPPIKQSNVVPGERAFFTNALLGLGSFHSTVGQESCVPIRDTPRCAASFLPTSLR